MGEAMTVIREYINEMDAQVARSVLEAHEIPAVVMGGLSPVMRMVHPVRLAVRAHDAASALRILDAPFTNADADDDRFGDVGFPGIP